MKSNKRTGRTIIAMLTAVVIAFTMYMPLSVFAEDAPQEAAVKAQSAEQDDADKKADAEKKSEPEKSDADQDADAEKSGDAPKAAADKNDSDQNADESETNQNADADNDADGSDADSETDEGDTDSAIDGGDAGADVSDADSEVTDAAAGTLINTDTPYRVEVAFGADAGIPEGAELVVREKPEADYIDQAAEMLGTPDTDRVAFAVFLDISIVKDGEEIQPSADVKVEVTLQDMPSAENGEMEVVHFEDEHDAEAVKSNTEDATVGFKADGFSVYGFVYTVAFTYGEYTFEIEGGSEILLSEIFSRLHIEEDLTGSETECSAPELFQIDPISEADIVTDWNLKSLKSFDTEETLTVNLASGDVVVITLTDDQPIARGNANPSGNVVWELYERGDEKVMEFKVLDPNASDEEKAITKIQKEGSTARIDNEDPLRTETDRIIIHDGITGIGWTALYDTSGYKPLFPNYSRDREQAGVFQDFWILKTVEIEDPSDIQRIGWSAFRRTYKLESIDLSSMTNLTEILNQAFAPSGLEELDLSGCTSLELIGHGICSGAKFEDKQMLTSVKLPKNLKTIGSDAFTKCRKLKYVSFEDISSVENVYELAFAGENRNLNPIEYIADEKTKQKAVLRQAAKDLFSNVSNLPDNIVDYTALDKYEPKLYWQLTLSVNEKIVTYNGSKQYGYEVKDVTGSGDDTCSVSGLQDGHVLSVDYKDPSKPSYGTNAAEYDNGSFENAGYTMMYEGYNYAINYQVSATPGKLKINKLPKLTVKVTGNNDSKEYNGTDQNVTGYDWKVTDPEGVTYTEKDFTFKGNDTATRKIVGKTEMGLDPDQFTNNNANIDKVEFDVTDGYMEITQAKLKITAKDKEYTYNGSSQGPAGTYTEDFDKYVEVSGLQGSDALTSVTLSGSETNAGEYADEIKPSAAEVGNETITKNYEISYVNGKLTITPLDVTVTVVGHNGTKVYNGKQQSVSGYDFSADSDLYTESDFTFSGSDTAARKDVGTTKMGLAAGQFENTNDNFGSVTFTVTDGSIKITKKSLTITTGSASKTYDGNALTSSKHSVSGLASGDTITVKTTGSRTDVGSSRNTYTVNWGATKKANYDITEKLGTLTVEAADDPDDNGGGNGGNGGNNGNGGNAAGNGPAAGAAPAGAVAPGANIADNATPLADGEVIEDEPVPEAVPEEEPEDMGYWALLNLILTLLTILLALLLVLWNKLAGEADSRLRARRITGVALAVLAIIVLILTEDFTQPIQFIDQWTVLMGLIFVLEAAVAFLPKLFSKPVEGE